MRHLLAALIVASLAAAAPACTRSEHALADRPHHADAHAHRAHARDDSAPDDQDEQAENPWQPLFDGDSLDGWQITSFGGEGEVSVEDGRIRLDFGNNLTGITWEDADALPRTDYELQLHAMRVDGNDFFCGLTFPVGDEHCSLIVGGWGGTVVGLSSIDGFDASENESTVIMRFETGRWYHIRLRVEPDRIQVWIDDEQIINADIENRHIGIRPEVARSRPLGIASFATVAALRDIRLRPLPTD